MIENAVDRATDAAAVAAITSPMWHHYLSDLSTLAGTAMPILGCIWLGVQIYYKTRKGNRE